MVDQVELTTTNLKNNLKLTFSRRPPDGRQSHGHGGRRWPGVHGVVVVIREADGHRGQHGRVHGLHLR